MSQPEVYQLAQVPLTCHSFSPDRSQVAVSLNSNEVQIFSKNGAEWKATETLSEHDKTITSIDWAPNTNRIVTCSQDRNAYVWEQKQDPQTGSIVWKPTLVLLRINRAATFVRWSPKEDKFAVASGARAIAVCSFDEENNWWVAKQLKKPIRSTVLAIDWHPNNVLLAAGSADMKARVFSAFIKDVDKKPAPTVWGEKLPFNTVCGEYGSPSGGWVHSVAFSPSGDLLAFASHDSTITLANPQIGAQTIRISTLPYVTLTFTSESSLVAAGHDCQPVLFSDNGSGWALEGSLDDITSTKSPAGPRSAGAVGRLNNEAFNRFKNADSRGTTGPPPIPGSSASTSGAGGDLLTVHQNTITSVRPYNGGRDNVTRISTTGKDGLLVIWDVAVKTGAGGAGVIGVTNRLGGMHLR
ncbi:actin-related protein 2/3 complex subunit 1 [Ceratobasidium sp. AG-Ba]|nr:actin-related protein 2/3 complex subunit 1 [Ceratobasidium sp. AG-Ba]